MPQIVGVCCGVEKTKVSGGGDFFGGRNLEWKSRCRMVQLPGAYEVFGNNRLMRSALQLPCALARGWRLCH